MTNSALELKKYPRFTTDQEAEDFVADADLTEFDLSDMKRVRFEFQAKGASVNLRLPKSLLDAVRARQNRRRSLSTLHSIGLGTITYMREIALCPCKRVPTSIT